MRERLIVSEYCGNVVVSGVASVGRTLLGVRRTLRLTISQSVPPTAALTTTLGQTEIFTHKIVRQSPDKGGRQVLVIVQKYLLLFDPV